MNGGPVHLLLGVMVAAIWIGAMVRYRGGVWSFPTSVVAGLAALAAVFFSSGLTVTLLFEQGIVRVVAVLVVALMSWLVLRLLFPRLTARHQAPFALLIGTVLAIAHVVAALGLWRVADDGVQLASVPVANTEAEILALRDGPYRKRLFGVLTEAKAGEVRMPGGALERAPFAYFSCRRVGSRSDTRFPDPMAVTLGDGRTVLAAGIVTARQAWNWPEGGQHVDQCALRIGDPIVIWSDVAKATVAGSGRVVGALSDTRLVAYGTLADFRQGFVPKAVLTGQVFTALAAAAALLALIPLWFGIRLWRRLRRHGSDERPKQGPTITWSRKSR
jgi:hypothetical protein